jgi:hypothetical protein
METLQSKKGKKRTFRVRIKRKDSRKDLPYLSCVLLTNETILLEFQTDDNSTPEMSELMERLD